uniref:DUF5672 domain-containing protein n=1 Tax=viral metagenome TaxID=1070528 RepID=A0A6C0CUE3_9ZZZZ
MNTPEWNECIKILADSVRHKPITRVTPNKVAVIIEPRNHIVLQDLLIWMVHLLAPHGWHFIVYHGNQNKDIIPFQDIIELRSLGKDNLTIEEYNSMCKSIPFWQSIPYENILIFQTDSVILDENLDRFLQYDYLGAPWSDFLVKGYGFTQPVGNGGLSLRRRTAMIGCLASTASKLPSLRKAHSWEDQYFSQHRYYKMNIPSKEIAQQFSVETIYYENTIGYHKPWLHLKNKMNDIYEHIKQKRMKF